MSTDEKAGPRWCFAYGPSPSYRFREAGPFDSFRQAREAAAVERRAGYSTARPEKREATR